MNNFIKTSDNSTITVGTEEICILANVLFTAAEFKKKNVFKFFIFAV